MNPLEMIIGVARWTAANFAYNLDHVPDDKLHWKPSETAASVATITVHVTEAIANLQRVMTGQEYIPGDYEALSQGKTREELKQGLLDAANSYADLLETFGPADLEGEIQFPWGAVPRARAVTFPTVELVHHHGQIAYLQTLWGDTTSHFLELGN